MVDWVCTGVITGWLLGETEHLDSHTNGCICSAHALRYIYYFDRSNGRCPFVKMSRLNFGVWLSRLSTSVLVLHTEYNEGKLLTASPTKYHMYHASCTI